MANGWVVVEDINPALCRINAVLEVVFVTAAPSPINNLKTMDTVQNTVDLMPLT